MPWSSVSSLSASRPITVILNRTPLKQFDLVYSLLFIDSRVTELQALAAAYVEALEGQVNDGKSRE
jgi:hypothetical protein